MHQEGRAISPVAYAWYARAVHHEQKGDLTRAERDYRSVLKLDDQSGAAWAGLGRIVCRRSESEALKLFTRGLRLAPRKAPILVESARCKLAHLTSRSDLPSAASVKLRAICEEGAEAIEQEPNNPKASAFVAHCYRASGDPKKAARYARGARLYLGTPSNPRTSVPLKEIDRALWKGDLAGAQEHALETLAPGELAARALAWGKEDLAEEQALLVHRAAPKDGDALVVLVILGKKTTPTRHPQSLSDVAAALFALHLERTIGPEAAQHFRDEAHLTAASSDPLVRSLLSR